jgi:hypothetical protein
LLLGAGSFAADTNVLAELLRGSIIGPDLSQVQAQAFTERRVPPMPEVKSKRDWEKIANRLREDALTKVVFRGEAERWRAARGRVKWLDIIDGGPGYRIKKLRYEALPGLWIPALLYEPEHLSGKVPVMLNVNGHDGKGKAADYKQLRCINQVKRGMIVLNPEWLGMGQLNGENHSHGRMNQLDLCGSSGLAPFYLAMTRGLDILLAHRHADPARVGVSGLSGGGWQTITISSLDPRVTLCNPVAGYSSFRTRVRYLQDLGDSEQTPCDLATVADYAHLTAMLAPRPVLLTYNAKDNCCFGADHALAPLWEAALPIYALYGKESRLRSHINQDPGDHNFGLDNRQAHYRLLGDFFFPGATNFDATEIPSEAELKTADALQVDLPDDNANFHSLALALSRELPREPAPNHVSERWQRAHRLKLREVIHAKDSVVSGTKIREETTNGLRAMFWKLRVDQDWTIPAVELSEGQPMGTVLLLNDGGRAAGFAAAAGWLAAGRRVLLVDPFYLGESKLKSHEYLFALMVGTVGERPLGIQASQIAGTARWLALRYSGIRVELATYGPRTGLIGLAAAALEENAIGRLELHGGLASLKEVLDKNWAFGQAPEMFCFGLLEAFDIPHLRALVSPRPVVERPAL